jgi:hypothetical protein
MVRKIYHLRMRGNVSLMGGVGKLIGKSVGQVVGLYLMKVVLLKGEEVHILMYWAILIT